MKYIIILLLFFSLKAQSQSCIGASSISSSSVSYASATINFTANEDVLNYVIVYYINPLAKSRQNVNDPGPSYPHVTSGGITGLTPSTLYTYYVVTKCNAGDSVVSSTASFTTTAAPCNAVTGPTAANITQSAAYIYATAYQYATSYTLKYVKQGNIDTVTVGPSANPTWQLSNLLSNTIYSYRIYSTCPSGVNSAASTFTTLQAVVNYTPMSAFGYDFTRINAKQGLGIPQGTTPSLNSGTNKAANLFYDSVGKGLYVFDVPSQTWNNATGCTIALDTYSDSLYGPVTGDFDWTPTNGGVEMLMGRDLIQVVRNGIPLILDDAYTYNSTAGTITFTDIVLAEESFSITYSCGSTATPTGVITYTPASLTDGSTITWDYSTGSNKYVTIQGNRQLAITNIAAGRYGTIIVTQGTGGSKQLIAPANSKQAVVQGTGNILPHSVNAGDIDIYSFYYDGAYFYWTTGIKQQ